MKFNSQFKPPQKYPQSFVKKGCNTAAIINQVLVLIKSSIEVGLRLEENKDSF